MIRGLVVSLALVTAMAADAQSPPSAVTVEAAHAHFEMGRRQHELGNYLAAVDEFKQAYLAQPEPIILFDIAQSYRRAGRLTDARAFYQRFIERVPDGAQRRAALQIMRELEASPGTPAAAPSPPSSPSPSNDAPASATPSRGVPATAATVPSGPPTPSLVSPPPAPPARSRRPLWIGLGVTLGALGVAAAITAAVVATRTGGPSSDLGTYPVLR